MGGGYGEAGVDEFIMSDWNLGTGAPCRDALDSFVTEVAVALRPET